MDAAGCTVASSLADFGSALECKAAGGSGPAECRPGTKQPGHLRVVRGPPCGGPVGGRKLAFMTHDGEIPLWPDHPSEEDLLGFADIAAPIGEAIRRERLDPVAIGVFGDWGSGKTTVLKLVGKQFPQPERPQEPKETQPETVLVIWTQPWEYDPVLDPKATLIDEVLSAVQTEVSKNASLAEKLKARFEDLRKRVDVSKAITLAAKTAITVAPPSIDQLAAIFTKDSGTEQPTLQGFRDEYAKLMDELEGISRVVVLVDDLDRCLPETVVGTLEAIKLFLSVPRMGFVIAADERSVTHAIATRYRDAPKPQEMARDYLEKIIQIPLTVPALGESDTEAYLALLLLRRHFEDNKPDYDKIIQHCAESRARSAERVLDELPDGLLVAEAANELPLAAQLAPVLARRLAGNPRRLKRFLNAYWLRADIAARRDAELEPPVLAKLLMLERLDAEGFNTVLDWLQDGELAERLAKIEAAESADGLEAQEAQLLDWAHNGPKLAGEQLGPYLRLAASLQSRAGARSQLRSELRDIVGGLLSDVASTQKKATTDWEALGATDQLAVAREMVRDIVAEPRRQANAGRALQALGATPAPAQELIAGLGEMAPRDVEASLVISIAALPGGHDLVRRWLESGELTQMSTRAAAQALAPGK